MISQMAQEEPPALLLFTSLDASFASSCTTLMAAEAPKFKLNVYSAALEMDGIDPKLYYGWLDN